MEDVLRGGAVGRKGGWRANLREERKGNGRLFISTVKYWNLSVESLPESRVTGVPVR